MTTHLHQGGFVTACGIDKRTGGLVITTNHKAAVTCPECRETPQYKIARQAIPQVYGGPYRG